MTRSILVRHALVEESLKSAPTQGSKLLEPFKALALGAKLPCKVLEDAYGGGEAEAHLHEHDLWFCLEGEVQFTYGGTLVDPEFRTLPDGTRSANEKKGSRIEGGVTETLRPGDWLYIPAGEPHQHRTDAVARLMIIKIPAVS